MSVSVVRLSLVVSTVNRAAELTRLMDSLLQQEFRDFEIVVVDQNRDDRIVPVLERYQSELRIGHIRTPTRRGISAARNDGWRRSCADVIVFPDDDCWYPPWFLRRGLELLGTTGAALVSGRFADKTGRSINGRFASRAQFITRRSVWTAQSESACFYRRELLEQLGGFDENVGIGSPSPWQAAEGPDFVLSALQRQRSCYYDPSLYGFHREYDLDDPNTGMVRRGRMYGRGMGFILRRHRFGFLSLLYWVSRPLVAAATSMTIGRFQRAAYSASVMIGRIEGWTNRVWVVGAGADVADLKRRPLASETHQDGEPPESFATKRREMTGPYRARNPVLVGALFALDVFARVLPKRHKKIAKDRPLRVLVTNWGHMGDVVTILPLLKFLECHPRVGELAVLIGSGSRPVLESSDIVARIHVADHWALNRSKKSKLRKIALYLSRYASIVHEIRQCQYDLSIDTFATFPSSNGITWSASIPQRVGFKSGGLGPCLTDPFDWIPDDRSMMDQQLKLLKPLLGELHPESLPASYPGFNFPAPESLLGIGQLPYIVIHMGPQNFRAWVPEKWSSLATILKGNGYELVVTGGPGDEAEAARVLSENVPVKDLTGRISWNQFVATVANAIAIVTIDSVAGHVAACFGVPSVTLIAGRQRLNLWRPNSPNAFALTHPVGCAPCHRTKGCAVMACVRQIEVADVLAALQPIMKSRLNSQLGKGANH